MITIKKIKPILIVLFFSISGMISCNQPSENKSLVLYCAAGIKPPVEKLAREYEKISGVQVEIQYGGSGTLLSGLRIAQSGDLYLAADESYLKEASKLGLIAETQPLAYLSPVIAVKKGNPKNIAAIEDLLKEDISFSLGNPDAASIGKYTKKILESHDLWEAVKEAATVFKPTVNEVANDIRIGAVDAGIIWDATVNQYEELDFVHTQLFDGFTKQVTVGVLSFSEQPTAALGFLRYLSSREFGNLAFETLGYKPVEGDIWEEKPSILFFSGGVNRIAIESTIQEFESREGVTVERVYNGCGILVAQIKAGQRPDAYFTCDISFMDMVHDKFKDITDVSNTKILMAVKQGNPKNVAGLNDLLKEDMRIGVCNPQQSALGELTKRLLEQKGIWEQMLPNVYSQTPTADLLVNQLRTGSLDAVIVYEANISKVRDKVTVIPIDDSKAIAFQNYGIGQNTTHYWLLTRLLKSITSNASREVFLDNGFGWEYVNDSLINE